MCTMTWWRDADSYGVHFNRDEKKTRPRALPPQEISPGILAPTDSQAGGTWLTVNAHGLIIALLNRWHEQTTPATRSRGLLVKDLASSSSIENIIDQLENQKLKQYPPFTLLVLDNKQTHRWDWNADELIRSEAIAPVTSSSYKFHEVKASRENDYQELPAKLQSNILSQFHSEDTKGAFSVRMCRPDAQTWSRSEITVSSERISWLYLEEFLDFKKAPHLWKTQLLRPC